MLISKIINVISRWLDKENTVADDQFNRWRVIPAAVAVHLCIGMAYGFSVFWIPLSQAIGITKSLACDSTVSILADLFTTTCDWRISSLGWIYTLFFVVLGLSAATGGSWLERAGPRKAGILSAVCWCGGLYVSALGIYLHQLWLLWLGAGVIGGIGLGIGYISPVSTLIKWFPDHRGMATGLAIMGFGSGALIGSPVASWLMRHFASGTGVGVMETFIVMASIYLVIMLCGALAYRVPASDWLPKNWNPTVSATTLSVNVRDVWRIPQFWLVWLILCMNVSAGIGIIGMISPMMQEIFGGSLVNIVKGFSELTTSERVLVAGAAAGFVALASVFNTLGRFFWSSCSDFTGRRNMYTIFFITQAVLFASMPWSATTGNIVLFVVALCIILSMYGGGFATVPAYLADLFGTGWVGAIHGRLLTAWSTAGIIGPVIVNYMRDYQIALGIPRSLVYNQTMYILIVFLAVGLAANLLVRPVHDRWFTRAS